MTRLFAYRCAVAAPLIARLLLDAQHEFVRAADAVPTKARNERLAGLNAPGWVVAHAGFFHDVWINVDGQGKSVDDCEPWLRAWIRRQDAAGFNNPIDADFEEARAAVDRVVERTTPFIEALTDASLEEVPAYEEGAWRPGTTLGYLVARDIAHLFAHASELNIIATASGGSDIGLPGNMQNTSGRHS
jgi:hypothetical protein